MAIDYENYTGAPGEAGPSYGDLSQARMMGMRKLAELMHKRAEKARKEAEAQAAKMQQQERGSRLNMLDNTAKWAGLGGMVGPKGMAVGAGIGALMGLKDVYHEARKSGLSRGESLGAVALGPGSALGFGAVTGGAAPLVASKLGNKKMRKFNRDFWGAQTISPEEAAPVVAGLANAYATSTTAANQKQAMSDMYSDANRAAMYDAQSNFETSQALSNTGGIMSGRIDPNTYSEYQAYENPYAAPSGAGLYGEQINPVSAARGFKGVKR